MLNRKTILLVASLVGIVAVAFIIFSVSTTCCATKPTSGNQLISPANYHEQFVASNTAHLLIDVRTPQEFSSGHIRGAVNIPVESLATRLNEVPNDQAIVVYCRSGNRSAQASQILEQAGYNNLYDLGGLNTWTAQGFPIE